LSPWQLEATNTMSTASRSGARKNFRTVMV
jgi:hypothetical protein